MPILHILALWSNLNHWSFTMFCRMKASMDTTRMSNFSVLMSHLQTCLIVFPKDQLIWFSRIGYSCIFRIMRSVFFIWENISLQNFHDSFVNAGLVELPVCFFLDPSGWKIGWKDDQMVKRWWVYILQRILFPSIWRFKEKTQPYSLQGT